MLEVEVLKAPTVRYTQDNQTPIAEMEVQFEGLRADDPPGQLKVVGWGNLAQELQNRVEAGQKLVLEGRLRMNTIPREDGTKEKRSEFTLSRMHPISPESNISQSTSSQKPEQQIQTNATKDSSSEEVSWNSAPLVPDTDDIPF